MKIRTRLTILFTIITATILLAFASVVYISAKENREKEFYSLLKKEGLTKANLFFNAKVESKTLQDIYRNNREILNEVEVAIYDTDFNLLYHDAVDIDFVKETKAMIDEINQKEEVKFYQDDWQVLGFGYRYQNKNYIITAAAYDQYGFNKLNSLLKNSIIVFIISTIFIYIAGLFFSKKAFDPVKEMTNKAKQISATNLDLRLNNNGKKDELAELANTFNEMLNRLENSFDAQKHFVSNISHELRTPLAAIITELELSTNKEKNVAEYKSTIQNALGDAKKLVRLLNSLLDLAKASYDPSEIAFKPIRID
jgi:two-component system sensor histidine kinase ArlS